MIKALIFDLDNCLAPSHRNWRKPRCAGLRRDQEGKIMASSEQLLQKAFADIWRHPLDWVAAEYGFSKEMTDAAWKLFATMEVQKPMSGYGDLGILSELPGQRFLVTSGFRRLQESKNQGAQFPAAFHSRVHGRHR